MEIVWATPLSAYNKTLSHTQLLLPLTAFCFSPVGLFVWNKKPKNRLSGKRPSINSKLDFCNYQNENSENINLTQNPVVNSAGAKVGFVIKHQYQM